ncbi:hypothetical protein [Mycobacteroides abscessus]|uniref:hypothetical protein n=1 Tax=Mycobacteroides abscessus TaxID=36809 RepID=UPI000C2575EE|nr:hypothetical protein [Mycobacteroides abscessus]
MAWLLFEYNVEPLLAMFTDEEHQRWNDVFADWPNEAGTAAILDVARVSMNEAIAADGAQLSAADDVELERESESFCVKVFLGSYQGETIGSWAARVVQPAAQALLELSDQPHKWLDRMRAVTDQ